uniref:glutathione-specific gamma-glutamylcyclotransferase n=1 Tax=Glossina brevipalpis TaxID=37001 RepID=A0A1A9X2C8_9MUSC
MSTDNFGAPRQPPQSPNGRNLPRHFEDLFLNCHFSTESDEENDLTGASATNINPSCWVFGYGSLCWNPGFEYERSITGYIKGFVRRFWQGNVTHRGTLEKPGRVATLVEDYEGLCWGCAYKITGQTALDYLKQRECTLGGYRTVKTKFYPRIASYDTPFIGKAEEVIVYLADDNSRHWLGEDIPENIAQQIVECRGASGHNAEYLLRLAKFMHDELPDVDDEHLFQLEYLVLNELQQRKIPLESVMGTNPAQIHRDPQENLIKSPNFQFSSRMPERKLRCLNI